MEISKRKLESYKKAEIVCRELRFQIAGNRNDMDLGNCTDMLIDWLSVTTKSKWERPENKTVTKKRREMRERCKEPSPPFYRLNQAEGNS